MKTRCGVICRKKSAELKKKIKRLSGQLRYRNGSEKVSVRKQRKIFKSVNKLFRPDQLNVICNKSNSYKRWSPETLKDGFELYHKCGKNGYNALIKKGYPLPSIRTLNRKLENLFFSSGILEDFLEFTKINLGKMNPLDKFAGVFVDEMSIVPGENFYSSTNKVVGNVSIPECSGEASHALVFMVCGLRTRWKQVIAYYFTGKSVNGEAYTKVFMEIIKKCEQSGIKVVSTTSDMGPANMSLWKILGIGVSFENHRLLIRNKIAHPFDPDRFLYFYADVPHLDKNTANGWRKCCTIKISRFHQA